MPVSSVVSLVAPYIACFPTHILGLLIVSLVVILRS